MSAFKPGIYPYRLESEERSRPDGSRTAYQPFARGGGMSALDRFAVNLTREQGLWIDAMTAEQTAFALAQLSADRILPPLVDLETGFDLLEYHVALRDVLDGWMVDELSAALDTRGPELHWGQIDSSVYAAVIGAGVAACIDVSPGCEMLFLRYASQLAADLYHIKRAAGLPFSLLGLQTILYERFDGLLACVRDRAWYWLIG